MSCHIAKHRFISN
jgi:hypothetical protein